MTTQTKTKIKTGFFCGIFYAIIMAGFDFLDKENFHLLKFLFNFLFFGICMASMMKYKQDVRQ